jgi:hypothetical protein
MAPPPTKIHIDSEPDIVDEPKPMPKITLQALEEDPKPAAPPPTLRLSTALRASGPLVLRNMADRSRRARLTLQASLASGLFIF